MFDATSENVDGKAFAERCEDDRHHFRFIVSPEDAPKMADLKSLTRKLMKEAEHDLGTKLDWVAVDHWNTDNPHIHVLVRGKLANGKDLVISRDYISHGFRLRAAELVGLELGPRSQQEIQSALEKDVRAERWTAFDQSFACQPPTTMAALPICRPGPPIEDPELRRLLLGRAQTLERLGLAEQIAPGQWTLKAGLEQTLRDLGIRGDIIKTMHRAMSRAGREPDVTEFALHPAAPDAPIVGRLAARGLQDELNGTAYAIIEGIGRAHAPPEVSRPGHDRATHHTAVSLRAVSMRTRRGAGDWRWPSALISRSRRRLQRRAQPGSTDNCWRAIRWSATPASAPTFARRCLHAPIISSMRAWHEGRGNA